MDKRCIRVVWLKTPANWKKFNLFVEARELNTQIFKFPFT